MSSQEPHSTVRAGTGRGDVRGGSDAGHGRPLSTITASDFDDELDAASDKGEGSSAGSVIVAESSPVSVCRVCGGHMHVHNQQTQEAHRW